MIMKQVESCEIWMFLNCDWLLLRELPRQMGTFLAQGDVFLAQAGFFLAQAGFFSAKGQLLVLATPSLASLLDTKWCLKSIVNFNKIRHPACITNKCVPRVILPRFVSILHQILHIIWINCCKNKSLIFEGPPIEFHVFQGSRDLEYSQQVI